MSSGAPGGARNIGLMLGAAAAAFAAGALAFHLLGRPSAPSATPEAPKKTAPAAPKRDLARPETIVGAYFQPGEAQDALIALADGKLTFSTGPGQTFPLEPAGERRYRIGPPMPAGYQMTVRPAAADPEHFEIAIERPGGLVVMVPRDAAPPAGASAKAKAIAGLYRSLAGGPSHEIAFSGGRLVLASLTKSALVLRETATDTFVLGADEAAGVLRVRREGERVIGVVVERGADRIELARSDPAAGSIGAADLRAKAITALGGEAAIKALRTLTAGMTVTTEGKGVTAEGKLQWRAPDQVASELASSQKGKQGPRMRLVVKGGDGAASSGGQPMARLPREAVGMLKAQSPVLLETDWQAAYPSVVVRQFQRASGEELIAVEKTTAEGVRLTDHYDAKSFLLRRREVVERAPGSTTVTTVTTTFEDYRPIAGVLIPLLRTTTVPGTLAQQLRLDDVRANVDIPDAAFELK